MDRVSELRAHFPIARTFDGIHLNNHTKHDQRVPYKRPNGIDYPTDGGADQEDTSGVDEEGCVHGHQRCKHHNINSVF